MCAESDMVMDASREAKEARQKQRDKEIALLLAGWEAVPMLQRLLP